MSNQKRINYQTVAMAFLTGGVDSARAMLLSDGVANPHVLATKAAVQIDAMGGNAGELNALAKSLTPESVGAGRGRTRAKTGDRRRYKAQQVISKKDGAASDLFIRLPVSHLVALKEQEVEVYFDSDRLVISAVKA